MVYARAAPGLRNFGVALFSRSGLSRRRFILFCTHAAPGLRCFFCGAFFAFGPVTQIFHLTLLSRCPGFGNFEVALFWRLGRSRGEFVMVYARAAPGLRNFLEWRGFGVRPGNADNSCNSAVTPPGSWEFWSGAVLAFGPVTQIIHLTLLSRCPGFGNFKVALFWRLGRSRGEFVMV
jgi:hypothetical protein